jgi:hypothetical protein
MAELIFRNHRYKLGAISGEEDEAEKGARLEF